jgi:hypothetical protein
LSRLKVRVGCRDVGFWKVEIRKVGLGFKQKENRTKKKKKERKKI